MLLSSGPTGWEDMRLIGAPVTGAHYLLADFTHGTPSFLLTMASVKDSCYRFELLDISSFRAGPLDPCSHGSVLFRRVVRPASEEDPSPQRAGIHGATLCVLCRCTEDGTPLEPDGSPWAGGLLPPQPIQP